MSLLAGSRLGDYEIVSRLGEGGMGELYRVRDKRLGRDAAIKVLRSDVAADVERRRRFEEEAKAASALNHPNIVTVYHIGDHEASSYIVMELIDGQTLRERLDTGPAELSEVQDIARQLCAGLRKAHGAGVIHGDLKPENIMVDRDGLVKIVDFGLARLLRSEGVVDMECDTFTKEAPVVAGTLSYMAPEQALGQPQDARSDVFSLGVVLYELTTGRRPFTGDTAAAVIDAILHQTPSTGGLPPSLEPIVLRCLEKQPRLRFRAVEDLQKALEGNETAVVSDEKSVAVVPFKNLSAEPDTEFFSDGLTEDIILDLSRVGGLRVISRTSAMMLKGTDKDLRTLGRTLGVRYLLEGSVRTSGTRVRITAQLIDTEKDAHVWSDRFTGTLDDVFAIQEDIARKIVDALKLSLTPEEDRALAERPIDDPRAYEYYARARQEQYRFSAGSLDRALGLLDDGLEILGDNELLCVAKGFVYWNCILMQLKPYRESMENATRYCNKAFELGGRTSQAYFLRGALAAFGGDWQASVSDYKKALEIRPGDSDTLFWLCHTYAVSGRTEAARRVLARLFEIDPLTPANYWLRGLIAFHDGRFESALEEFRILVNKDPNNPMGWYFIGITLTRLGRGGEAGLSWQRVRDTGPGTVQVPMSAVFEAAVRGERKAVVDALSPGLRESAACHFGYAGDLATACALAGAHEEALEFLEQSIDLGWINVDFFARYDPSFEKLRGNERFENLIERGRERATAFEE